MKLTQIIHSQFIFEGFGHEFHQFARILYSENFTNWQQGIFIETLRLMYRRCSACTDVAVQRLYDVEHDTIAPAEKIGIYHNLFYYEKVAPKGLIVFCYFILQTDCSYGAFISCKSN